MKTTDLATCKMTGVMFMERRTKAAEDIRNKYWKWCQKNYQPYVHAYISGGKATVTYDLPTGNGCLDLVAKTKLLDALIPLGFENRNPQLMSGEIQELPLDQAEIVAAIILNIGRDFCARTNWKSFIAGQTKIFTG